jgi:predicted transcriptional regulator of viral defense system
VFDISSGSRDRDPNCRRTKLFLGTVGEYLERPDNGAVTKRIVYFAGQLGIDLLPARNSSIRSRVGTRCWI